MRPLLLALVGLGLALTACSSDGVRFDRGLALTEASFSAESKPGGSAKVSLTYLPAGPLDADYTTFVHAEGEGGCRTTTDLPADAANPPTAWATTPVTREVTLSFPATCKAGELQLFTGLYDRKSYKRLKTLSPKTSDHRMALGHIDLVDGEPDSSMRSFSPASARLAQLLPHLRPWKGWAQAVGGTMLLALLLLFFRKPDPELSYEPPTSAARWLQWLPAIPFGIGLLTVLEFVKDDGYISFRYAYNLIHGEGLVFNTGERVEGYTNFLWTVLMAPFEALGLDLFQVCEWLAFGFAIPLFIAMARAMGRHTGFRRDASYLWGALLLATSSSFTLWSKSGLEQPLAMLLPMAGAYTLWRAREANSERGYIMSALLFAGACLTRPELHIFPIFFGLWLLVEAARQRRIDRGMWLWVAVILGITAPFHAWRYSYYGGLFPNTFYVKTGAGDFVWQEGLKKLREMFGFNYFGLLTLAMPFAFLNRRLLLEKLTIATVTVFFMAFMVKVGVDEMHWHRLYLPALPFAMLLAAIGLRELFDLLAQLRLPAAARVAALAGWLLVLTAASQCLAFTYREMNGFNGHGDLTGTYHPDLGKFLVRHERPGALVAFQDVGSTPYHAPDINFLDFIGLVDFTVARARNSYGLHAFIGSDPDGNKPKFNAEMREYYFKRNPEWAILTIYTPDSRQKAIADAFAKDPGPGALGDTYNNNPYQFEIWRDARFRKDYVHVRTWQRSRGYYLSLFRRRDLWEQTPGEVVLDAPPADMGGVTATFEGGLELLGSRIDNATDPSRGAETLERHEIMVTTWWRVPGPMEKDLNFFLHLNNKEGYQAPADHVPGDSMYPADRWKPGQIIEDRYLFQLPMNMRPGEYEVNLGAYVRSTGHRLAVTAGKQDGANRVGLGPLTVGRLYPLIHQLIPPTNLEVMRKYPERIVSSGRVGP